MQQPGDEEQDMMKMMTIHSRMDKFLKMQFAENGHGAEIGAAAEKEKSANATATKKMPEFLHLNGRGARFGQR